MTHVRQQIRDAVATTVTGLATGATVYKMRKYDLDKAALPAILVYTMDESSGLATIGQTIGQKTLNRNLTLVVEVLIEGNSDAVFNAVDTACEEVEAAVSADFYVGGLAKSIVLTSTATDVNVEGSDAIGSATMQYTVNYWTSNENAGVAL